MSVCVRTAQSFETLVVSVVFYCRHFAQKGGCYFYPSTLDSILCLAELHGFVEMIPKNSFPSFCGQTSAVMGT